MRRHPGIGPVALVVAVALALVLALACGSSGGGGGNGLVPVGCPGGFDAGNSNGGTIAVSQQGQCGTLLNGTTAAGQPCQTSSDCQPSCCECPNGTGRSSEVAWCRNGACVTGTDVCCEWIDANQGFDGGGAPFNCVAR